MEAAVISHELSQLDYTKVAPLQQKRSLAFVNHFVQTTVQFLNNFVDECETKLQTYERKIQKVEASLVILESKLQSIPELAGIKTAVKEVYIEKFQEQEPKSQPETLPSNVEEIRELKVIVENKENNDKQEPLKEEYKRFAKMVQVGVPIDAVKLKINLEGLDPDYFETHYK